MPLIGMPSGFELVVIALVLVLLFGGAKIPALMKGMGQGIREFRKEVRNPEDDGGTAVGTGSESKEER